MYGKRNTSSPPFPILQHPQCRVTLCPLSLTALGARDTQTHTAFVLLWWLILLEMIFSHVVACVRFPSFRRVILRSLLCSVYPSFCQRSLLLWRFSCCVKRCYACSCFQHFGGLTQWWDSGSHGHTQEYHFPHIFANTWCCCCFQCNSLEAIAYGFDFHVHDD